MTAAETIIAQLQLRPLVPEGGYFARTWTSTTPLSDGRAAGTAIYFLLTSETFSAFHRLKADELWHFYDGDPVEHWQLGERCPPRLTRLGRNLAAGEQPQLTVKAGTWQGAKIDAAKRSLGWSLLGCTMTPGWRDDDFELLTRAELLRHSLDDFPSLAELVRDV